ncbi:unnamed protein product, partial [Mesorhabditis belari]|uniref:Uncharacterized protein n=1 Tax=Mesorhabditis belari TaxID=2138241 RepID=A0AAF3EI36_9BILA
MLLKFLLPCLLFVFSKEVLGAHECVWITGQVNCQHDPSKISMLRVYDRDSTFFLLKLMDPDDLMGVTFSSENGFKNKPEPYIQIRHYCNKAEGETITLPEFSTFVPNTYELGTFQLDGPSNGAPKVNLKTNRT